MSESEKQPEPNSPGPGTKRDPLDHREGEGDPVSNERPDHTPVDRIGSRRKAFLI